MCVCVKGIICVCLLYSRSIYVSLHLLKLLDIELPLPSLEERTKSLGRRRATTIIKQEEEELEPSTMIVQEGSPLPHEVIKNFNS